MSRILIADSDANSRDGLKRLLAADIIGAKFSEAVNSEEMLALLAKSAWDLLILNVDMPAQNGFEELEDVRRRFPSLPVLILGSLPEDQLEIQAIRKGANGLLNKRAATTQVSEAVRTILAGEPFISTSLGRKLVDDLRTAPPQPRHQTLSDRELQICKFLVMGKSLKEIAAELSLSSKTVSTFHVRVLKKLGLRNDVELARYADEHRLL